MSELPENTIMALDLTRPIQTRSGRPVRILATDGKYTSNGVIQPIIAAVEDGFLGFWSMDGTFNQNSPGPGGLDLINVPPSKVKKTVELRIIRRSGGSIIALCMMEGEQYNWGDAAMPGDKTLASTTIELEYEEPQP
jgi:hypothetical protein